MSATAIQLKSFLGLRITYKTAELRLDNGVDHQKSLILVNGTPAGYYNYADDARRGTAEIWYTDLEGNLVGEEADLYTLA